MSDGNDRFLMSPPARAKGTEMLPNVSVFGSCRVHTPCSILARAGEIRMTQKNIFGFTHYAKEILQQFELVSGARQAPSRLRPYLNIPSLWKSPPPADFSQFDAMFRDTDLFVIEISSIRELVFKALFLQINRVNELVVGENKQKQEWWKNLLRRGRNSLDLYPIELATPLQAEIVQLLKGFSMIALVVSFELCINLLLMSIQLRSSTLLSRKRALILPQTCCRLGVALATSVGNKL